MRQLPIQDIADSINMSGKLASLGLRFLFEERKWAKKDHLFTV